MATTIPPTVLLTRPKDASARFAARLDGPVVISPLMETQWLSPPAWKTPPDAVVFTSARGVDGLVRFQDWRGRAFCVGDRTAEVARAAGFDAKSAGGGVEQLSALLEDQAKGLRLVHARGRDVAGDLSAWATPYIVYAQMTRAINFQARALLEQTGIVIVPLFSPRSAARAGKEFGDVQATLRGVALSANVADAARAAGVPIFSVADAPNADRMVDVVRKAVL